MCLKNHARCNVETTGRGKGGWGDRSVKVGGIHLLPEHHNHTEGDIIPFYKGDSALDG